MMRPQHRNGIFSQFKLHKWNFFSTHRMVNKNLRMSQRKHKEKKTVYLFSCEGLLLGQIQLAQANANVDNVSLLLFWRALF